MSNPSSSELNKLFQEFVEKSRQEDGSINVFDLLGVSKFEDNPHAYYRERIQRITRATDLASQSFLDMFPGVKTVNNMEARVLHDLAEWGFPYWYFVENFQYSKDAVCSEENPILCLEPETVALIIAHSQIISFAFVTFFVLLLGGIIGICSVRRRLRKGVVSSLCIILVCFLVDLIGLASVIAMSFGNILDLAWAPFAGLFVSLALGPRAGFLVLMKEVMPVLDIVPLATLMAVAHVLQ